MASKKSEDGEWGERAGDATGRLADRARPDPDHVIADLARVQHGVVQRDQLVRRGVSSSTFLRRIDRGHLIRLGPSTAIIRAMALGPGARAMAACLETGGLATGVTASHLYGLWTPPRTIEVVVPQASGWRDQGLVVDGRPVFVHTTRSLPPEDANRVDGIPTTSVARTLLAMAAKVPTEVRHDRLVSLIASGIDADLASTGWLWWMLERRRRSGRNGVVALESALAEVCALGATESWLERHVLTLIAEEGLPTPTVQHVVRRSGRFVARVDFSFDPDPVVVEALGYGFHRTREQLDADTRRANELQVLGLRVLQFTYDQLVSSPARSMAMLRAVLTASRPSGLRTDPLAG